MGGGPVLPVFELPPQLATAKSRSEQPSIASQRRRRTGIKNKRMQASTDAAECGKRKGASMLCALDAVVVTVTVAFTASTPLIATDGAMEHVAGSLAATGVIAQVRLTVPAKLYQGVTATCEVLPVVAPGASETGAPVMSEK